MLELGPDSIREHMAVGTQVVRLNISRLVVVGREARSLYVSAVNEGSWGDECVFAETAGGGLRTCCRPSWSPVTWCCSSPPTASGCAIWAIG